MKEQFGYAIGSDTGIYHLIDVGSSFTLCGLSAVPRSQTKISSVDLQVIADLPQHARLCRHCDDAVDVYSQ
ncbi:MAG TPA: hypothetical protein VFR78_17225 [Pyrinomonadaceae bacterium]|nr:hypothetical protein [Pyrinomonadaceae bacterium]